MRAGARRRRRGSDASPAGHLYVLPLGRRALAKDRLAWALRARERGRGRRVRRRRAAPARTGAVARLLCAACWCARTGTPRTRSGWSPRLVEHFAALGRRDRARASRWLSARRRPAARDPHRTAASLPADAAIVCAGAWSKPLAASARRPMPLETERGYHLMIRDPEVMPRIPTADADGKFVATPMDAGLRFAGHGRTGRARGAARLAARANPPRAGPPNAAGARRRSSRGAPLGVDGAPPERCPIRCRRSGRRAPRRDVIYAFGHGHVGMTAAPMTGSIVADLVAGRPPSIDIAPFAPARVA